MAEKNNEIEFYNVDKQKRYLINLSKGEIEKSLKAK